MREGLGMDFTERATLGSEARIRREPIISGKPVPKSKPQGKEESGNMEGLP